MKCLACISFCLVVLLFGCKPARTGHAHPVKVAASDISQTQADTSIVIGQTTTDALKLKDVIADLDGDGKSDTASIFQHPVNKKYGLKIVFGNGKIDSLAAGKDIEETGLDDLNWIGVFERVAKGSVHFNNVNDEGEIIGGDEVAEKDKICLPNEGIFIHQAEACGGGIIYLDKGKYRWIQQE